MESSLRRISESSRNSSEDGSVFVGVVSLELRIVEGWMKRRW